VRSLKPQLAAGPQYTVTEVKWVTIKRARIRKMYVVSYTIRKLCSGAERPPRAHTWVPCQIARAEQGRNQHAVPLKLEYKSRCNTAPRYGSADTGNMMLQTCMATVKLQAL
jgi:hypothetical protein